MKKKSINQEIFKYKSSYKFMLLGLLSISASNFHNIAYATTHNALYSDDFGGVINLQHGDKIEATIGKNKSLYGITINTTNGSANLGDNINISVVDNGGGTYNRIGGIAVSEQGQLITGDNLSIDLVYGNNTSNSNAGRYGIVLSDGSTANLGKNNKIAIRNYSKINTGPINGINVTGSGSLFKSEGIHIDVLNSGSGQVSGITVKEGGKVDLGVGSSIIAESNSGNAFGVTVDGLANANDSSIFTEFYADNLKVIVNRGSAASSYANGFDISGNTIVDLGTDSYIKTSGDSSSGVTILTHLDNTKAKLTANALTIYTDGEYSVGISAQANSVVKIGAGSHITTKQAASLIASTTNVLKPAWFDFLGSESNRNTISSGAFYGAAAQGYGATVNLAYTDIINNGAGSAGIWALKGGKITGNNLTIYGAKEAGYGVHAQTNSSIDLTGNTAIYMADPMGIAISTTYTDGYAPSQINATGKMDIIGGILSRGGIININMDSGSQWDGWASSNNNGVLNVALTNSIWNMNADSNIDSLVLYNSTVDISNVISKTKNPWTGSLLTLGGLSGNGHFILRTDVVGDGIHGTNDKLVVTDSSEGNYQLTALNSGSLATTGNEVLTLVETPDGKATFNSTHQTELGGYLYDVRKNGTNWELYGAAVNVVDPNPEPEITTAADAGANFLNVGYLMNYAETQTLLQRMGDLRQNAEHGDIWLRGFAGKFDSLSGGKLSQFDMSYSGMQIGADKRVSQEMPLFVGVFMGQTQASPDYRSGDGTIKSSNAGIYGSYMAVNGFYMDAVAKYSHMKNNFSVKDSQDNLVRGNGNSDGVSFSLEAGQKFSMVEQNNGLYIEPQLQLTYGHQDATRIKASNGLRVDLGSYESLTGRASALLGYELNQGDSKVNVYLKAGIVREFKGDVDYQLNGSTENHTFNGNWWNNGVGVSTQINKQHTLYLDLDSSTGNKFNQRQINGGYRFSF